MAIVTLEHVSKSFGDVVAVNDVSLRLKTSTSLRFSALQDAERQQHFDS